MSYYASSAPVSEGQTLEVDVTEISRRGDGIAKVEGFVIFVPNTKAGDHVNVKIRTVRNRFAIADVVE